MAIGKMSNDALRATLLSMNFYATNQVGFSIRARDSAILGENNIVFAPSILITNGARRVMSNTPEISIGAGQVVRSLELMAVGSDEKEIGIYNIASPITFATAGKLIITSGSVTITNPS